MTVRLVMRSLQMAGVITAWAITVSIALGIFATVCGAALGAVYGNFGLTASIGARGVISGLIAGAIVGLCVAADRLETESYLAKAAMRLQSESDWPATSVVKPRYPEFRMTHTKSVRGL
jgi:hypothetical protein